MSATFRHTVRRVRGRRGVLPAPGPDVLCPAHRVTVLVVVIVVMSIAWLAGRPIAEAAGLVLAAGGVADQLCRWLGGQPDPQLGM